MTTIVSFDPSSSSTLPYLQPAAIDPAVCVLPLLLHRVPAGFPSPADEYVEKGLDLNTYLVRNKVATLRYPHKISLRNNVLLDRIWIKTRSSWSEHKISF